MTWNKFLIDKAHVRATSQLIFYELIKVFRDIHSWQVTLSDPLSAKSDSWLASQRSRVVFYWTTIWACLDNRQLILLRLHSGLISNSRTLKSIARTHTIQLYAAHGNAPIGTTVVSAAVRAQNGLDEIFIGDNFVTDGFPQLGRQTQKNFLWNERPMVHLNWISP